MHNGFFFLSMYFVYYINLVHRLQMTNRQIYWIFDVRFLVEKTIKRKSGLDDLMRFIYLLGLRPII